MSKQCFLKHFVEIKTELLYNISKTMDLENDNMKKRLTLIVLVLSLLLSTAFIVYGDNNIVEIFLDQVNIQVNGKAENIPNLLYNNKTYVSLRELCNVLGIDIKWEAATNNAKLTALSNSNTKSGLLDTIIYLFSKIFTVSGLILLAQVVFNRVKKDFYFVRKFDSSNTTLKRLIYTGCIARIGFYYITIGTVIGFLSTAATPPAWVKLVFIPLFVLVFWFFGMSMANSISHREQSETLSEQE